jgi:hypothetical protein
MSLRPALAALGAVLVSLVSPAVLEAGDACPVSLERVVPASSGSDGPGRLPWPLVGEPSEWRGPDGVLDLRYQQLVAARALPGPSPLTGVVLRLDPASEPSGDVSWAVEVRVGAGPEEPEELLPDFEANARGPQALVFDAVLTSADGPTLVVPFEEWVSLDPSRGGLLVDIRVKGAFGDDPGFALDAHLESDETGHVFAGGGLEPQPGPGGLVLGLQTLPSPAPGPGDYRACLRSLRLPPGAALRLEAWLRVAEWAAGHGRLRAARALLDAYSRDVQRLAAARRIDPATAEALRHLGTPLAGAVEGAASLVLALRNEILGARYGFFPLDLEGSLAPSVPAGPAGAGLLQAARGVDGTLQPILVEASGFIDDETWEKLQEALDEFIEEVRKSDELDAEEKQQYEDLRKLLEDKKDLESFLDLVSRIFKDGRLDRDDAGRVKELVDLLKRLRKLVAKRGTVGHVMDWWIRLLADLLAALDSKDLESIEFKREGDCYEIKIDVKDGEKVELRVLQLIDLDTGGWYGKTNLYLDMVIRKDTTIRICIDEDGMTIEFIPPDGIEFDLDSSGIFVVDAMEEELGIPSLDRFTVSKVRIGRDGMTLEGKSGKSDVKIDVTETELKVETTDENGKKSSKTFKVEEAKK